MPEDNVKRLRELCEKATPGPLWVGATGSVTRIQSHRGRVTESMLLDDARLIAAARNALPLLLDVVEAAAKLMECDECRAGIAHGNGIAFALAALNAADLGVRDGE